MWKPDLCLYYEDIRILYASDTPINRPIPNVNIAAAMPTKTCLVPENKMLRPVISVIAAPMMNKPTPLIARLR